MVCGKRNLGACSEKLGDGWVHRSGDSLSGRPCTSRHRPGALHSQPRESKYVRTHLRIHLDDDINLNRLRRSSGLVALERLQQHSHSRGLQPNVAGMASIFDLCDARSLIIYLHPTVPVIQNVRVANYAAQDQRIGYKHPPECIYGRPCRGLVK